VPETSRSSAAALSTHRVLSAVALSALALAALSLPASGCARSKPASNPGPTPIELTAEDRQVLPVVERLGKAIYENDNVSSRATDMVLPVVGKDAPLAGWVTTSVPEGWRVDFYQSADAGYTSYYRVTFKLPLSEASMTKLEPPEPLDANATAMVRARETAQKAAFPRCKNRPYNHVVLPAELLGRSGWLVYLLAAHVRTDEVVLGGHARVHVSADGTQMLETFALSKGCLVGPADAEGLQREGIVVSTLVANHPLETHVFLSLLHKVPVHVIVPSRNAVFVVDPLGLTPDSSQ
jgi:hypothetical protein